MTWVNPNLNNTSATNGYLVDVANPPSIQDDDLTNLFQEAIAGITGLDPTLVRPNWQPQPPTQPSVWENWCALGIYQYTSMDYPIIIHDGINQVDNLYRNERLDLRVFFYGPQCFSYASILRDGLYIDQNYWELAAQGLRLRSADDIITVSELINSQYVPRADLGINFTRMVQRTYNVLNIVGAEVVVTADDGDSVTTIISQEN